MILLSYHFLSERFRFGKSIRFGEAKKPQGREFLSRPSTSSSRSCSFGLGGRTTLINQNSLTIPSPNAYTITPEPGKGFSIQGKPNPMHSVRRISQLPGPGFYEPYINSDKTNNDKHEDKNTFSNTNVNTNGNANKNKIAMRGRLRERGEVSSPGPCAYTPNLKWVVGNVTGGYMPKALTSKSIKEKGMQTTVPGPGSYNIASCFGDKGMALPPVQYKNNKNNKRF